MMTVRSVLTCDANRLKLTTIFASESMLMIYNIYIAIQYTRIYHIQLNISLLLLL